jgi:hypothetical protein
MPSGDEDIPKVRRRIMISKVADIDRGHPQTTRQLFDFFITPGHDSNPNPPDNFLGGLYQA